MGAKLRRGYIIIRTAEASTPSSVVGLGRKGRRGNSKWVPHSTLTECFVHSSRSVWEAVQTSRLWTREATTAYEAVYRKTTGYAEPEGEAIPFDQLKAKLAL